MDNFLNDGGFAGAFRTGDEDVVSGAFHLQPEGDGPYRPFLADHLVQRFDVGGGFEIEHGRVAQTAQVGERYFVLGGHSGSSGSDDQVNSDMKLSRADQKQQISNPKSQINSKLQ